MPRFSRSRRAPSPRLRRRLWAEPLEDRAVPATLYVDDSLIAGAPLASLGGRVSVDRDGSGTLTAGDRVTFALGETGETTKLTFDTTTATVAPGDDGAAFQTIQAAIDAAVPGDTILVAAGNYAENVTINKALTVNGATGVAPDVVIHPAAGLGIVIAANGVTVSNLRVTGATDGVSGTGVSGLTLTNLQADTNTANGVNLTGLTGTTTLTDVTANSNTQSGLRLAGASGATLALASVTASNNTLKGLDLDGFATYTLSGLTLLGNAAATPNTVNAASSPGSTVNFTGTVGNVADTITASSGLVQDTRAVAGSTTTTLANQGITLAGVTALNLFGDAGADQFVVTPAAAGGTTISVDGGPPGPGGTGGDVLQLDLTGVGSPAVSSTFSSSTGFTGTWTFADRANLTFTGIESFANGATITGTVFNDINGNGSPDSGEGTLGGVTVRLDVNGDGTPDLTTVTDSGGHYTFSGLPTGSYTVTVVPPSGMTQTTPAPAAISPALGQTVQNVDFGLRTTPPTATGGTVRGVVFADLNANGVQDSGEKGLEGFSVFLDLNGNGKLDAGEPSAVTGTNGTYSLSSTQNGTFAVIAEKRVGFLHQTKDVTVTLDGGNTLTDVNVGLRAKLPPQATPAQRLAVGVVVGGNGHLQIYDNTGKLLNDVVAFANSPNGARVAVGDVNGDGTPDYILGTGPGVPALVRVLDGKTLNEIISIPNVFQDFTGGVYVASGDVNGDGADDVVVSADVGGGTRIRVFRGGGDLTFPTMADFFGIRDLAFRGGSRVTVADVTGDGMADVIVAAGFGGGPRVTVWDGASIAAGNPVSVADFFAFDTALRNGVFVAAGDLDGDGVADLIVGAGPGGGPEVRAVSSAKFLALGGPSFIDPAADQARLIDFFAGDVNNRGGIRVSAKDLDGDGKDDLVVGSGDSGGSHVTAYTSKDLKKAAPLDKMFDFDASPGFAGGVFVG